MQEQILKDKKTTLISKEHLTPEVENISISKINTENNNLNGL